MQKISQKLGEHYSETFKQFGSTSEGVDWGSDEAKLHLRYRKMLAVMDNHPSTPVRARPSLLDVGCGFGGLLQYANNMGLDFDYTGIDVAQNMIDWAASAHPEGRFFCQDFLDFEPEKNFDYVVCNGILTQKLDTPGREMDDYAQKLIRGMFEVCRSGVAFNAMTTRVNFFSDNLYYRDPLGLAAWCIAELTPHFRIDHAYPLYEYTIYLLKEPR
ncbi:biotin biosynthesis protein BioC [Roseibium album]|nr:biotin biosynthesis protein BioC [Roseibium album]